jgi:hypothetical protein
MDEWMNQMLHSHMGILYDNIKEWNSEQCYNMEEPWKYCAKVGMLGTKDHVFDDSIYMNIQSKKSHKDQKLISAFQEHGWEVR